MKYFDTVEEFIALDVEELVVKMISDAKDSSEEWHFENYPKIKEKRITPFTIGVLHSKICRELTKLQNRLKRATDGNL